MRFRVLAILTLPLLLLSACSQANLLPKEKPTPKSNSVEVDIDFKALEIPKHALGEGWHRVKHEHSTTPGFPPRGAFKGVGESQKLEVTFNSRAQGEMTLVASKFDSIKDAEAMLEIILISKPDGNTFTESKALGYVAYDSKSTRSKQTGKMLNLGNVLVSVFSEDPSAAESQERLLRYLFSKLNVPTKKD